MKKWTDRVLQTFAAGFFAAVLSLAGLGLLTAAKCMPDEVEVCIEKGDKKV